MEIASFISWSPSRWSGCPDLNRGPPRPERGALPTALHPDENSDHGHFDTLMVTSVFRTWRATEGRDYQPGPGDGYRSHLYLQRSRARNRILSPFLSIESPYRWRIWDDTSSSGELGRRADRLGIHAPLVFGVNEDSRHVSLRELLPCSLLVITPVGHLQ